MSDINDLLSSVGITQDEGAATQATALGEDDIDSILSEHGFHDEGNGVVAAYGEGADYVDDRQMQDIDSNNQESQNTDAILSAMDMEEHMGMEDDDTNEGYDENQGEEVEDNVVSEETTTEVSLLPSNSPTLLLDDSTSRFSGTEWYNEIQKQRVILAGLGGIGSSCAYNLARMHLASLVLYDDDVVDWSNLSGQFYSMDDVGRAKVDAAQAELQKYATTTNIYAINHRFDSHCEAGDIMICGFDNMAARKAFFTSWKKHLKDKSQEERAKCLFLDGRLSISVMQVFCITGDDDYNIERYRRDYLFSDSEADPEYNVCSLKQTTYLASMIGALMTNLFTNFVANQLSPIIPYKLPFFTEYDANYMIFKEVG